MPRFELACSVTVSAYTAVEAETLEEAIKAVKGRPVELGGPGSYRDDESEWVVDDADGVPFDVRAA